MNPGPGGISKGVGSRRSGSKYCSHSAAVHECREVTEEGDQRLASRVCQNRGRKGRHRVRAIAIQTDVDDTTKSDGIGNCRSYVWHNPRVQGRSRDDNNRHKQESCACETALLTRVLYAENKRGRGREGWALRGGIEEVGCTTRCVSERAGHNMMRGHRDRDPGHDMRVGAAGTTRTGGLGSYTG
ncbi:hypothetical protein L226DRAFT_379596 [Lentinus tigrinus ALCF2SS1-7]|uniref:Uncharacterized protein n=1 Tax=Lentinus tigrinus ALCF2SS1-6 TaxID=1328759 RepID=A0A5C2SL22_9APHY|nr:hypothetical protein L227DRAFT_325925 [Lentinus tigrinus ALCF2SS1-6]RPD76539.1 hypothetical protein L226DRAFT_379596 [Lentinus tigrinus ALCF2SS1-7]